MNEEMIDKIRATDSLSQGEQLLIYVAMLDASIIMAALKHHGLLQGMGLALESPVHAAMYGVMRIVRPELFEGKP